MVNIQRKLVRPLLERHRGKWFTVTFTKKDGTLRTLNGKIGAVEGHDDLNTVSHLPQYVTVNLSQRDGDKPMWRNASIETMVSLSIAGETYSVIDNGV